MNVELRQRRVTLVRFARHIPFRCTIFATLWLAAASACVAQCSFPGKTNGRVLTYAFDPTVTPENTVLHVTLSFQGNAEGAEEIEFPTEWAGEKLHGVTNIRAVAAGATLTSATEEDRKTVSYPPSQQVVLTYDMAKDWTGSFNHPFQFHGVLMPDYIEINGENAFVYPKMDRQSPVTVNFDWQKLPASWVLATSFGTGSNPEDRCQSFSGPLREVRDALFAAGVVRVHHFQIGKRPAILAIRGQWTFTDEEAITTIQQAIGLDRDFWHDDNFPYFLITMDQFDRDRGSGDGTAFTNAIWMYMSRQDTLAEYFPTFVHEGFHAWNPRRMGVTPEGSEKSITWFHEGFTRYYQYVLAYRAGRMSLPEYLDSVNSDLRKYSRSNDAYARGNVIGVWLNQRILADSNHKYSLDTLMFDMVRDANKPLTLERILQTAGRYITPADRVQLQQAVENGALPEMEGASLGPCAHFEMEDLPTFDLGLDYAASSKAGKVLGVDPDGPAFKAGLRDGQVLSGRISVYNGQPDKTAIFTVQTDDGRKAIEYYPLGKAVRTPQFHLDKEAYAANQAACRMQ
jgi:predicted metalloprotease with PDZ domain